MFKIGVEEEVFVIDALSKEPIYLSLRNCEKIFSKKIVQTEYLCQLEYRTKPCQNIDALKNDLYCAREQLDKAAANAGLQLMRLSLHPFMKQQAHSDFDEKYIYSSVQIHIELPKQHLRYPLINHMLMYLPLFLALSGSSPIYLGQQSGLHSTRSALRGMLPRHGLAPYFDSMRAYQHHIATLSKLDVIDFSWDIRPHLNFPTIENRIMDHPHYLDDILALAALNQALIIKLYQDELMSNVVYSIRRHPYLIVQ